MTDCASACAWYLLQWQLPGIHVHIFFSSTIYLSFILSLITSTNDLLSLYPAKTIVNNSEVSLDVLVHSDEPSSTKRFQGYCSDVNWLYILLVDISKLFGNHLKSSIRWTYGGWSSSLPCSHLRPLAKDGQYSLLCFSSSWRIPSVIRPLKLSKMARAGKLSPRLLLHIPSM